jgi:hypothetical protein
MAYPIQTNYTAGELSPRLSLRVDFNKYANGLETQENYITLPHGGVSRRNGTHFVAEVKTSATATRLIPFEFSTTQAYIIEVGDQYMRFYRDNGRIEVASVPTEIATPYLEADIFDLTFAQSADTLYICHPSYAPRKLTRSSHTSWTLTTVSFWDGPYLDANLFTASGSPLSITLTPSAATGSGVTLTASANLFVSTDVGRSIRILEGAVWGWATITDYTSATEVEITINSTLTDTTSKSEWRLGAWSDTTGYPSAVTFFEERLAFGGSTEQPQTVWLSVSSDYEDFTPGADDDDALTYTIAANKVNAIKWLASSVGLLVGTVGGEFALFGGNDSPLTPTNVTVRRQSTHGSLSGTIALVGNAALFIQRSGKKIRELKFDAAGGTYLATDLTLLAEHITTPSIVDMSYQQEPDSIVWLVRSDGVLVSLTYNPAQEIIALARHTTDATGLFEAVATIPSSDGSYDETWVVVKRTIDGSTKRYVEYFDPNLQMDCALTYDGSATTAVSGLDHLEGEVVVSVGDGAVYPRETVDSGEITLDGPAAQEIHVGLHYNSTITTLRPEVKMPDGGTSQGKRKKWSEIFVRVVDTLGMTIEGDQYPFRSASDPMDAPPPEFDGDVRVSNSGWDRNGQLTFSQIQPLPSTILGHYGRLEIED